MNLHKTTRRLRWAIPGAGVIALAIAVPVSATQSPSHHHHGGGVTLDVSNNSGNAGGHDDGFSPPSQTPPFLHQVASVTFPAPFKATTSFDIGFVDPTTHTYYFADRTNAGVTAVNTQNNTFGGVIGAGDFAGATPTVTSAQTTACGTAVAGPNGVLSLTVGGSNQVWAGDGVSSANPVSNVKVFTLTSGTSGTLAATIPTGNSTFGTTGTCRADEMAYDPVDNVFVVANDADSPPYLTYISVNANPALDKVVGQLKFPGATGIEQTVWNPKNDLFYTNVPGMELAVTSPKTFSIVSTAAQPGCNSSGLALNPDTQQLFVSCSVNPFGSMLMSARTGAVLNRFPQVSGADEIWFDPGTNNVYFGANRMTSNGCPTAAPLPSGCTSLGLATPVIGVIASGRGHGHHFGFGGARWVENFATGATTNNTHSVAADPGNGQVYVPIAGVGVMVLANTSSPTGL